MQFFLRFLFSFSGFLVFLGASLFFNHRTLQAANRTANATQTVIAAIAIADVSNLNFGTDVTGANSEVIAAGSSENASNASFTVSGQPSTAYTVTLPADGTVVMTTAGGGANKTIAVNTFTKNTASGSYQLAAGGTQTLFVGATRAAIGSAQVVGSYSTTFTVSVNY